MPAILFIKNRNSEDCNRFYFHTFAFVFWGLLILTFVISGCTMVGPDYVKPTAPEPQEWLESTGSKIESKAADFSTWWTVFNDPMLNALVKSAYQQNLSLQATGIRILEARAQLGIAIGNQYPQTQQGTGDATAERTSRNLPNAASAERFAYVYDVGFDAAWELDFWGKFRRAVQAGVADLQASIADYDDNLVFLTSEVARTYINLRTAEERLAVARANTKIQTESLRLAQAQFDTGAVTELDVFQSRALLRSTEATIPGFESEIRQAKNALAILLGKLPGEIDAMLAGPGRIPQMPAEVTVGIPAELLRRRPDIRLAERQLAAQSALIGVAKADLFPSFSLFGSIGYTTAGSTSSPQSKNAGLSDMFKSNSLGYTVGPSITWNLFNYGRITNSIRVEDARFQQLAVDYENTVLQAVQEVEDAMIAYLRTQDQVAFLADAVAAYKSSVDLSTLQYKEGLVDFQRVLDAQQNLVQQQDNWVATTGDVGLNLISLYKALGGGWELRAGQDFVPGDIKAEMKERTNWGDLLSPDELEYPPAEEVDHIFNRPDW
ncbi:MAG: efflux transporter outer membrane subunit [Desulfobacterales bacterium]|jgi:NodT family efflux transporter outer membrane factor (OMF) lipoprotein|nr:efflux transporter outer membrane subunit [Desulfobacterales bacterium]MDH3876246.1 efflux transporter outer membrane subunit [Desulfobacterales bacterium]